MTGREDGFYLSDLYFHRPRVARLSDHSSLSKLDDKVAKLGLLIWRVGKISNAFHNESCRSSRSPVSGILCKPKEIRDVRKEIVYTYSRVRGSCGGRGRVEGEGGGGGGGGGSGVTGVHSLFNDRRRCDLFQIGNEFPTTTGALDGAT